MESFADFDNAVTISNNALVDDEGNLIERWAPLGANDTTDVNVGCTLSETEVVDTNEFHNVIEEHARLNSSLLLLTSHFAQVKIVNTISCICV